MTERFVPIGHDVVVDTWTGLQWTARDSGHDVSWRQADSYCGSLTLGGRASWRLPEIAELGELYDPGVEQACGERTCHVARAVQLADPYVWSATPSGPSRRLYFDFQYGTRLGPRIRPGLLRHVLCVRGGDEASRPGTAPRGGSE